MIYLSCLNFFNKRMANCKALHLAPFLPNMKELALGELLSRPFNFLEST